MSQVADAAGVARQTLYNHYGDIDSIVAAMIEQHNRGSIELLEASLRVAESPVDKLGQMVRHFASIGANSHHSLDLSSALAAELRTSLSGYRNVVEEHIAAIIEEGKRDGDFRMDLSVAIDSVLVRALLDGVHDLASRSPEQAAQIATGGTRTILAALS
jgi:AcrR family transcriptional regulator